MKLKGRALIRSMPHIQWQQQPEWLSDRMTLWQSYKKQTFHSRSSYSSLSRLTLSNVYKCRANLTHPLTPSLVASPFSPLQYAMRVWFMCRLFPISSSRRQHHHYVAVSYIWHAHPQLEQLCLGRPICFFLIGRKRLNRKMAQRQPTISQITFCQDSC